MSQIVEDVASDALSLVFSFLPLRELSLQRLVSKRWRAVADSDATWAEYSVHQAGIRTLDGVTPLPRSIRPTASGGAWKSFALRHGLHRLPASDMLLANHFGTWIRVASVSSTSATVRMDDEGIATRFFDTIAPPMPFHVNQGAATVGIVFVNPTSHGSPSSQAEALMNGQVVDSVVAQLLDFMQVDASERCRNALREQLMELRPSDDSNCVAALDVFGAAPKIGSTHRMVLALRIRQDCASNPASVSAVARLLGTVFNTCASIQMVADRAADITRFCRWFGESMPTVAASPFSTAANTPSIAFTTLHEPVVDMAKMVFDSVDHQSVAANFFSWVMNRTCSAGVARLVHNNLFSLAKPLQCPAWVNPAAISEIPPSAVLRMVASDLGQSTPFSTEPGVWSLDVMQHLASAQERHARRFYEEAFRTEFEDHTRIGDNVQLRSLFYGASGITVTAVPEYNRRAERAVGIPMDPLAMVQAHNQFFYVALRNFGYSIARVVGTQSESSMKLLEILKRNISDAFRVYWRRNNDMSREFCIALFEQSFEEHCAVFLDPESSPLRNDAKRGVRRWLQSVHECTEVYLSQAKGLRQLDILSEDLTTIIITGANHIVAGGGSTTLLDELRRASEEIQAAVTQRMATYSRQVDTRLNEAQHESAICTAALSNELASQCAAQVAESLRLLEVDTEAWEEACWYRIRMLTSRKAAASGTSVATGLGGATDDVSSVSAAGDRDDTLDDDNLLLHSDDGNATTTTTNLTTSAEQREIVISRARAVESDLMAQASRLASRVQQQNVRRNSATFAIVNRQSTSQSWTAKLKGKIMSKFGI